MPFLTDTLLDTVRINFNTETIWLLNSALALVMFGIALEISIKDFGSLLRNPRPVVTGVISQFLILPAVTFCTVYFISPSPSIALGMFMVAACPGGNISNFITHLAKGNTALSISLTAMATLLAIVMTPLNLQFWGGLYGPTASILKDISVSPIEMFKVVSLLLGVPLLFGMLVNHFKKELAQKMAKVLKIASVFIFVALIFIAFYKNIDIFMEYIIYVFWIVLLHNLVAFFTGFSFAKIMGLSNVDVRTITIETGIQNSGLGLLLIFTFFNGLGGMALLAAFWGIWHLISGLFLAAIWGYKPIDKETLA